MAIAEHEPNKLYKRNKGLLKMTKSQLHDYADTKEKGLPKRVGAIGRMKKRNWDRNAK